MPANPNSNHFDRYMAEVCPQSHTETLKQIGDVCERLDQRWPKTRANSRPNIHSPAVASQTARHQAMECLGLGVCETPVGINGARPSNLSAP